MKQQPPIPMTPFDSLVLSEQLQMFKLMLPYFPASSQRFLALFIKFQELMNTFHYFRNFPSDQNGSSFSTQSNSAMDLIQQLKPFLRQQDAEQIDMMLSTFSMMEMMKDIVPQEPQEMFDLYATVFQKGDETNGTMDEPSKHEESRSDQDGTDQDGS